MKNCFLEISSWGGLGPKPGSRTIKINEDGSFVVKVSAYLQDSTEVLTSQEKGVIEKERLIKLKEFAQKNITESKEKMVFDTGRTVKYIKDGHEIKVVNDFDLWQQVTDLVPECKKIGNNLYKNLT